MDSILAILAPLTIAIIGGTTAFSVKIVHQGNEALVERLGKFNRKLEPGINFIVPVLDTIVWEDTVREQVLDIPPQRAITKDNVVVEVDTVFYWKIFDLERAYYAINNIEGAIENLVLTTLRSTIGQIKLDDAFSSPDRINREVLKDLDQATANWGVKVLRVEIQHLDPPPSVLESMELERAAEIKKRAAITEAEATAQSMEIIFQALQPQINSSDVLKFIVAQKYVEASQKIGESPNSKVIFMDPKALDEALTSLLESGPNPIHPHHPPNNNGSGKSS